MQSTATLNAERLRLEAQRQDQENWRLWGPYLAERAWGTVREDYSPDGKAWEYLPHDQAHLRAYRWNEDGLGGICDEQQHLCFALALWNGRDQILKERAFGLTGDQGNHGEDVKECYFYCDATPSHSWLRYLYKYPHCEYPYADLVAENARRSRDQPPYSLLDSGVFKDNRYWDVEVSYAKAGPEEIHVRITVSNRGPETAGLQLLPTLWFRNTWSWRDGSVHPRIKSIAAPAGAAWAVQANHPLMTFYYLYGRQNASCLFTENDSNAEQLWGRPNPTPYVKDAFHRHVIHAEAGAVNPAQQGSKCAAWHVLEVAAGQDACIELVLSAQPLQQPFANSAEVFARRLREADEFYRDIEPRAEPEDRRILRQSLAGMIWNKQFFHYDVARWLDGDKPPPPPSRRYGRNHLWRHLKAADVISMPDAWEYPWFAAWDLSFHCAALAQVDVDFAKDQIELMLRENYLHPNGQLPAYEWALGDVNPPVHAMAALKVFRAERVQRGKGDRNFLQRVIHKLLLNYAWWLNRKDRDGRNLFEGGFMGMDNISVYNRSQPLPPGYSLKQSDATGWMAMFALNMTVMALELCVRDSDYEGIAIQCYTQFLAIANVIRGYALPDSLSLWDDKDGFFKDLVVGPDGHSARIDVFSWVGLIPLFACEVIDERLLKNTPRFRALLDIHKGGRFEGNHICQCPVGVNARGEHLLALVDHTMLAPILARLLDERQFLSPHGVRSLSRIHAERTDLGVLPGVGPALIEYVPGESNSALFGGNSNWRGPVWMPTNFTLIQALEKYYRFLGDNFKVTIPGTNNQSLTLAQVSNLLSERLVDIYRRDANGQRPAYPADSPLQDDPHWQDLLQFYEYFHGDTGMGLGAAHQTGWTGLLANLVLRKYREAVPQFWKDQQAIAAIRRVQA